MTIFEWTYLTTLVRVFFFVFFPPRSDISIHYRIHMPSLGKPPSEIELSWKAISHYPALTVGYPIFTLLLLLIDTRFPVAEALALRTTTPISLELLNSLSFYPVVHQGFFHWLCNSIALFTPMMKFERDNGTVHTGITLNLLAVFTGIPIYLTCKLLNFHVALLGSSGYVFSFFTYTCYNEAQINPIATRIKLAGRDITIPMLYFPVIVLFVWTFITFIFQIPSSFIGHAWAVVIGYLFGMGHMKRLHPPSKVILFIESKVGKGIDALAPIVTYYREDEAATNRGVAYQPFFMAGDLEASANTSTTAPNFSETRVLGT